MADVLRSKLNRVIATVSLIAVAGCGNSSGPEGVPIAHIDRPGGGATAIVSRIDGNATVSVGYRVYLQATDAKEAAFEVLRMDKGSAPHIAWVGSGLRIDVPCGQIYKFTNFTVVAVAGQPQ